MICPVHQADFDYSTETSRVDGGWVTTFKLFCGHNLQPHSNRGEPADGTQMTPGEWYEGPRYPEFVVVPDPKDAEIAELKAQLAIAQSEAAPKKKAKGEVDGAASDAA